MSNNIKYISKYQKDNTIQINIRLSRKYDTDVLDKLNSLDEGKSTYIKRLIREDLAKAGGAVLPEKTKEEETPSPVAAPADKSEADKSLNVAELAVAIGTSVPTISAWYRWKRQNPDNEYAKLLPDFFRRGAHRARYWHVSDIPKLIEFKNTIPQGRNGVMGCVTQKYYKNSRWNKGNAA